MPKIFLDMKTFIVLEESLQIPFAQIHTQKVTPEISRLKELMENDFVPIKLCGHDKDFMVKLLPEQIMRIYSANKKVYAQTQEGIFEIRQRLYEIEELIPRLGSDKFIRISNSEIVNLDFVKKFDMSLSGTIGLNFKNGERTFVSRRLVKKICTALGLK